jgi:hypothetical protein
VGTFEQQVPPAQSERDLPSPTPTSPPWAKLALRCEKAYGPRRDIEWAIQDGTLYLLQCRAVTTGKARSDARRPARPRAIPWPPSGAPSSSPTWTGRQAEQIARLLKERRFAKGETVIMEGSGGAAFFLIDSGEAAVSQGASTRHPRPGRLLRRDRPDRRRPAHRPR